MANTEGRDVVGRLRERVAHVDSPNGQYLIGVRVYELKPLLAVAEAAKAVVADSRWVTDDGPREDLEAALARLYDGSSGDA